jgi:hypothetical protein
MHRRQFHIGDRVRTIRRLTGIPLRTCGIVVNIFVTAGVYDVRFDGHSHARIVHPDNLERDPTTDPANGVSGSTGGTCENGPVARRAGRSATIGRSRGYRAC